MNDSALPTAFCTVVISKLYSTHQVLGEVGEDSLRLQNANALTHSSVVVHAVGLFHLTCHRLKLSAAQPMKNCSGT